MKNNHDQSNQTTNNPISQAGELAVIAGLINTLGDGLATVAAALALQEAQQSSQNHSTSDDSLQYLQKQIDDLSREVHQIKKFLRSKGF